MMSNIQNWSGGAPAASFSEKDVAEGRVLSLVSYIFAPLGIIPLVQRRNPYAIFHGKQALTLLIAAVGVAVVETVLFMILAAIKLGIVASLLGIVIALALLALIVMGALNAWNGKAVPLPLIGQYADVIFKGFEPKA